MLDLGILLWLLWLGRLCTSGWRSRSNLEVLDPLGKCIYLA